MKKRRFAALFTAFTMLISGQLVYADGAETTDPVKEQDTVALYSGYMIKNMIKTYAHLIADTYYYGIDDDELLYAVICKAVDEGKVEVNSAVAAMIENLGDKHAEFYTREEYQALTETVSGEFVGIGVTITQNDKGVVVISVIDGSPAMQAGIREGDYIIGVDDTPTDGMNTNQVRNLIVGESGTSVRVRVKRGEEETEAVCTRAAVEVSQLKTKMLDDKTAYMKLIQFTTASAKEVKDYVDSLTKNGTKKLVIDLRSNPGGDLNAAVEIARMFISAGKIAELRYKDETKNKTIYSENYSAPKLTVAVLVNEESASASEFLTAAFKGRKAAKIIGTKTYGKGSMQSMRQIATGAGMKYTVGEFYTVDGKRVNTVGVEPDIYVENEIKKVDEDSFEKIDFDNIQQGKDGGKMTLALEQRLEALGLFDEKPDEVFDEKTSSAVSYLQNILGYDDTGIPGVYEYMYLNDYTYDFDVTVDKQLEEAVKYLAAF